MVDGAAEVRGNISNSKASKSADHSSFPRPSNLSHPRPRSVRLLDQLRERIRYTHYRLRIDKTYVYWARFFIRFHNVKHPQEMGAREVEAFLSHLANDRQVSPFHASPSPRGHLVPVQGSPRHPVAWMEHIGRPKQRTRAPVVLSRSEIAVLLGRHRQLAPAGNAALSSDSPSAGRAVLWHLRAK